MKLTERFLGWLGDPEATAPDSVDPLYRSGLLLPPHRERFVRECSLRDLRDFVGALSTSWLLLTLRTPGYNFKGEARLPEHATLERLTADLTRTGLRSGLEAEALLEFVGDSLLEICSVCCHDWSL